MRAVCTLGRKMAPAVDGQVTRRMSSTGTADRAGPGAVDPARAVAPAPLRRDRLHQTLARVWDARIASVVAPPGCGKTTLLSTFVETADVPTAWYRADPGDGTVVGLLSALGPACQVAFGGSDGRWTSVGDAVDALAAWPGPSGLVVIDDLHALNGTAAERAIEELIAALPASIRVLLGSRTEPGLDLTRLRVAGQVVDVGPDDLRFRTWEVERLFRDHFQQPCPATDVPVLTRVTEGWAAGLQLFHLATTGTSSARRRSLLTALPSSSRLVREYLARNVLDTLPEDVRRFLLDTCLLGVLTPDVCCELLGRPDGRSLLDEAERRQLFVQRSPDGTLRYHELFRRHLEDTLVDQIGEAAVRRRALAAGRVLAGCGYVGPAVRAFGRAHDRKAISELLGQDQGAMVNGAADWLLHLPPTVVEGDPWLLLATARHHRSCGRLDDALRSYRAAESGLHAPHDTVAREERLALGRWVDSFPQPGGGWVGSLRRASQRDPAAAAATQRDTGPTGDLVRGVAWLLAGDLALAAEELRRVGDHVEVGVTTAIVADAAALIAELLDGRPGAEVDLDRLAATAEEEGQPWLGRIARAACALSGNADLLEQAAVLRSVCVALGDHWGAAACDLLFGIGAIRAREPGAVPLERAAEAFRVLGSPVLESWARAHHALTLAAGDEPGANPAAVTAESTARLAGARAAQAVAHLAQHRAGDGTSQDHLEVARLIAAECGMERGLRLLEDAVADAPEPSEGHAVAVRCLGGLEVRRDGDVVDLSSLRPRARSVLAVLAMRGGPVHWEVLASALWPDADADAARRNVHVAVSSLRRVLEPDAANRHSTVLIRAGEAYRLVARIDVADLEAAAHQVAAASDEPATRAALEEVVGLYTGELLPEVGPAEWAVRRREQLRELAVQAAERLVEHHLATGAPDAASAVARRGLAIDGYRSNLWEALLRALDEEGDELASARVRERYDALLATG